MRNCRWLICVSNKGQDVQRRRFFQRSAPKGVRENLAQAPQILMVSNKCSRTGTYGCTGCDHCARYLHDWGERGRGGGGGEAEGGGGFTFSQGIKYVTTGGCRKPVLPQSKCKAGVGD